MKLKPMHHQIEGVQRMAGREAFALFAEQGTGKTYMLLWEAEILFEQGKIDALLVTCPKGVHTNWINRELPKHLSCDWLGCAYKPGVRYVQNQFESLLHSSRLAVFSINIQAAVQSKGFEMCLRFLKEKRVYMIIDESHNMKNPKSRTNKQLQALGPLALFRRISTGTAVPNSPVDVFSQMEFLKKGLLGTRSFTAFTARFTKLLDKNHPLVRNIQDKTRARFPPQIPQKDENGDPIYQNLDILHKLLEPHSFRVLKKDCLDLPEKIYKIMEFEMPPAQRKIYETMKNDQLLLLETDDGLEAFEAPAVGQKLQQITSGFVIADGEPIDFAVDPNPRLEALRTVIEECDSQFIVWAKFSAEIDAICALLTDMGITHCQYHGRVRDKDRENAIDGFQDGRYRAFVGQPKAGKEGLTLTAAEAAIYYSNDFNLSDREQSEDRCHRIGTTKHVVYTDIVAIDSIDERILVSLRNKTKMGKAVMGELKNEPFEKAR